MKMTGRPAPAKPTKGKAKGGGSLRTEISPVMGGIIIAVVLLIVLAFYFKPWQMLGKKAPPTAVQTGAGMPGIPPPLGGPAQPPVSGTSR